MTTYLDSGLGMRQIMLLAEIERDPEHAYGVRLEERLMEALGLEAFHGTNIYKSLGRLSDRGLVKSWKRRIADDRPASRFYALTEEGKKQLRLLREAIRL